MTDCLPQASAAVLTDCLPQASATVLTDCLPQACAAVYLCVIHFDGPWLLSAAHTHIHKLPHTGYRYKSYHTSYYTSYHTIYRYKSYHTSYNTSYHKLPRVEFYCSHGAIEFVVQKAFYRNHANGGGRAVLFRWHGMA